MYFILLYNYYVKNHRKGAARIKLTYEQKHGQADFQFQIAHLDSRKVKELIYCNYHRGIEIIYVEHGTLELYVNSHRSFVNEGCAFIVNSELPHYGTPVYDRDCELYAITFNPEMLKMTENNPRVNLLLTDLFDGGIHLPENIDNTTEWGSKCLDIIRELIDEYYYKCTPYELKITADLFMFMYIILKNGLAKKPEPNSADGTRMKNFSRFIDFLENNYQRKLSVSQLASELYMSSENLYKICHDMTGQSPTEFIRNYRLEKAARLLVYTDKSVTEISELIGFENTSYFTLRFREKYSVTPLEYRGRLKIN